MRVAEFNLEQGIKETIRLINLATRNPVLVAFYGLPNSGKTYVIDTLVDFFESKGISTGSFTYTVNKSAFELIRDRPENAAQIQLYHCAWDKIENDFLKQLPEDEDPNVLAQQILGRTIDLNIGMYNPNLYQKEERDYDFMICNPDSVVKSHV